MRKIIIRKFNPEIDTKKPFDCGNADLNGFLLEMACMVTTT